MKINQAWKKKREHLLLDEQHLKLQAEGVAWKIKTIRQKLAFLEKYAAPAKRKHRRVHARHRRR